MQALLDEHDPATTEPREFLGAQYDAGLAWVHLPLGFGGLDLPRTAQDQVDAKLAAAGAPVGGTPKNYIGMGMAAPTIAAFGTDEQKRKFLRPLFTGEQIYCQLFSEPGAGSDLAAAATRAVRDGEDWIVNGQKVWTSQAQHAQMAILVARTDPTVPKHSGLTYFLCDMTQPGVEVRPLRQITGEAEFNEVFLTDVRVPDANRLGPEGGGWRVATTTLNNERVAIGAGSRAPREGGHIGKVTEAWRNEPALRNPAMHDELMRLWVEAEVLRLGRGAAAAAGRHRSARTGRRRHEGGVRPLAQAISGFEIELHAESGLRYDDWTMRRPETVDLVGREPGYRYLRARGNSIEGGTSEILRNTISERILGLPGEHRVDKDVAWKDSGPMSYADLLYSDTEDALRDSVRRLFADRCPPELVARAYDTEAPAPQDFSDVWRTLAAELGVAGLLVPESLGGAGASAREAAVVMEEIGRAVAPVPFLSSAVLATVALLRAGETETLSALAKGAVTAALVMPLSTAPGDPVAGVSIGADGLTGVVSSVAGRGRSRRAGGAGRGRRRTRAAHRFGDRGRCRGVAGAGAGYDETPCGCAVFGCRVVTGRVWPGRACRRRWRRARRCSRPSNLGWRSGASTPRWPTPRSASSSAARSAPTRRSSTGWPICGSRSSSATAAARYAADTCARGDDDAAIAAAIAQAYCSGVAVHAAEECVQLHGGIGMTWEYPAHLYLKRAKSDQLAFGTAYRHRARLAELVDLPPS